MTVLAKVNSLDWSKIQSDMDDNGFAEVPELLSKAECDVLVGLYDDNAAKFRSRIVMARHNFGSGEYKYFDYPLPDLVRELRQALFPHLAVIANQWAQYLGSSDCWPESLDTFLEACHAANQKRPTPLLLKYGEGDYNCLHQDLYGEVYFPFQIVIQLSERGLDYEGGELVLVEQRPRMQSRPAVITVGKGGAAIIPVRDRPARGAKGWKRTTMRHGVGTIKKGSRHTLGMIFHDAT